MIPSVELVDVHGAHALAEVLVLGPESLDRRLMLAALVGMADQMHRILPARSKCVPERYDRPGGPSGFKSIGNTTWIGRRIPLAATFS